jgi:hypothetical protein
MNCNQTEILKKPPFQTMGNLKNTRGISDRNINFGMKIKNYHEKISCYLKLFGV